MEYCSTTKRACSREWVERRNNESIMDGSEGWLSFSLKLPGEWELWPYEWANPGKLFFKKIPFIGCGTSSKNLAHLLCPHESHRKIYACTMYTGTVFSFYCSCHA